MSVNVTAERFAEGMTYDEYVAYIGTEENLAREATGGSVRRDYSDFFALAFRTAKLTDDQADALTWIASQPGGPAKVLVIAEDWSSDCRRDVPMLARVAAVTGMEMRIFRRDGQRFSASHVPSLDEAPDSNADLMSQFLNHKNGETWQSIPVAAFFDADMNYLYHYTEYPSIYEKDRVAGFIRNARPGEPAGEAMERGARDFQVLQDSPFFRIWASAGVDEIISALHRKVLLGEV